MAAAADVQWFIPICHREGHFHIGALLSSPEEQYVWLKFAHYQRFRAFDFVKQAISCGTYHT